MKKQILLFQLIVIIIIIFSGCRGANINNNKNKNVSATEEMVTYPLHIISVENVGTTENKVISDVNLIIIDSDGKVVGTTKTGKDGVADITVTVPRDKRFDGPIGTVTVIGYNNAKYRRSVMLEVPVVSGPALNQDIIMLAKTGYRDDEVNVCYGNMFHTVPNAMVNRYVPWNEK